MSDSGYNFLHPPQPEMPWDARGRIVGPELKKWMAEYRRSLSIAIFSDDQVDHRNGITVDPTTRDEHGPVPVVNYIPISITWEELIRLLQRKPWLLAYLKKW